MTETKKAEAKERIRSLLGRYDRVREEHGAAIAVRQATFEATRQIALAKRDGRFCPPMLEDTPEFLDKMLVQLPEQSGLRVAVKQTKDRFFEADKAVKGLVPILRSATDALDAELKIQGEELRSDLDRRYEQKRAEVAAVLAPFCNESNAVRLAGECDSVKGLRTASLALGSDRERLLTALLGTTVD